MVPFSRFIASRAADAAPPPAIAVRRGPAELAQPPALPVRIEGFNLTWCVPAGWEIVRHDARVASLTDGSYRAWLFVFGGSYAGDAEALADARSVFHGGDVAGWEDDAAPVLHTVRGGEALELGSVLVTGDGRRLRVSRLVLPTAFGTTLGVVSLGELARDDELRRLARELAASCRALPPREDRALAGRLCGSWRREGDGAAAEGGSEGWCTFEPSGHYRLGREAGSWRALGHSLVLDGTHGRETVDLAWEDDDVVLVGGDRYARWHAGTSLRV